MANSAMTHLPQVKSICSNIVKLGLLLLLDCLLHTVPYFIVPHFDRKGPFRRGADYPAEQHDHSSSQVARALRVFRIK